MTDSPTWGTPEWAQHYHAQHGLWPMAGGEGDPAPVADPPKEDPPKEDPPKADPDPDPEKVTPEDDWKSKSRKNETRAKKAERERDELRETLKKREEDNQTEQEKAIAKAREEARTEALTEAEKERRGDRLEVGVTRLAAKGITVGEGEKAKQVRFLDADDALLRVERGISRGTIDGEDIYDEEGKVKTDALTEALVEIATANPHLVGEGTRPKPGGDPDTGKGDPADSDLESLSPEDHAKRKYPANK